jgi:hypothetical protein
MREITPNKKILTAAVLATMLCCALIFTTCGQLDVDEHVYTITFFAEYPVKVKKTDTIDGKTFEYEVEEYVVVLEPTLIKTNGAGRLPRIPADPERPDDYSFDGWFTSGVTRVTIHTIFTSDTRVVARWKSGESIQIEEGPITKEFTRIKAELAAGRASPTYTINVTANEALLPQTLEYSGSGNVRIILNGFYSEDRVNPEISISGSGSLFTVGENVTMVLRNVRLQGSGRNTAALLSVNEGGTLIIGEDDRDKTYIYYNGSEGEKSGGGITVNKGGELIMNGGEIYNCTVIASPYDDPYGKPGGGGVLVRGGTFTMNGGNIEKCYGHNDGGGVLVDLGGRFTMKGGILYDNSAPYGGGVATYRGGLFEMEDGELYLNVAYNGGGVFVDQGRGGLESANPYDPRRPANFPGMTFEEYHAYYDPTKHINDARIKEGLYLSGGKIHQNFAIYDGGGVCNSRGGITYMDGGELDDNTANDYGAGVYNLGLYIMMTGEIKNNDGRYGGGVFADGGMFILQDGKITKNYARQFGGGVVVYSGQFAMHGGEISENRAEYDGGGLAFLPIANAFAMSGGVIRHNTSNYTNSGTLYFLYSADPAQIGLAYYGTRPTDAVPGDSAVIPIGREANVNGTNTFIWQSYLANYLPNSSGVLLPQHRGNNVRIEVIDGTLYIGSNNNRGLAQPLFEVGSTP